MAKPRYKQIADEIRTRIANGELRPGTRVPSARQITAKWGVAIATATKVLGVLRQEGVVKVVPGIGTVVADGPVILSKEDSGGLSRSRIVSTAIEIADTEGMPALSMRRIASELDASTMSLYRYVRGKDELILHMIDAVFGEVPPPKRPEGWRNQLELGAHTIWAMFKRHPWLAPVMSLTRPQMAPNALHYTSWVLKSLEPLGLDINTMVHIHVTLFGYVRGIGTSLEPEAEAEQDTGVNSDEWMQTQEDRFNAAASSAGYDNLLKPMMETDLDMDLNTIFEFGLARILDGLSVLVTQSQSARSQLATGGRSRRGGSRR
jgi:DNA-binding transcriptional regulator YhcF (GntR family)